MSSFSERLRQTRRQRRMNQEQLARLTGITTRSVQNYESGSRMPNSLEITEKLAAALDVTTTYLPGEIVVVSVGDETTLKRYYPEPEKGRIRLHPENESMEDMYVRDCLIQGVAVKVIKDL